MGELRHNYEQMTEQISSQRADEFIKLKKLIVETIRDSDVYEREESVRKILVKQINSLKDCKFAFARYSYRLSCQVSDQSRLMLAWTEREKNTDCADLFVVWHGLLRA